MQKHGGGHEPQEGPWGCAQEPEGRPVGWRGEDGGSQIPQSCVGMSGSLDLRGGVQREDIGGI